MLMKSDKLIHFSVCLIASFGMALCTSLFLGRIASICCGALFSLGLGLGKECGDAFNPSSGWDWLDLLADGLGIALGAALWAILS